MLVYVENGVCLFYSTFLVNLPFVGAKLNTFSMVFSLLNYVCRLKTVVEMAPSLSFMAHFITEERLSLINLIALINSLSK